MSREGQQAHYDNYVLRACYRQHLDHLKRRLRTFPLPADHATAGDYQTRLDTRLDLEDALGKLGATIAGKWETVMRMRRTPATPTTRLPQHSA